MSSTEAGHSSPTNCDAEAPSVSTRNNVEVNIFELELADSLRASLAEPKAMLDTLAQLSTSESLLAAQNKLSLESLTSKPGASSSKMAHSTASQQAHGTTKATKAGDGKGVLRHLFLDKPLSTSAQALISPPLPVFQQNARAHYTKPIVRVPTANYEMEFSPFKSNEEGPKANACSTKASSESANLILPSRILKTDASKVKPIPYMPYNPKFEEFAKSSHPVHSKASIMVYTSPSLYNLELDMRPELPAIPGNIFQKPYFGMSRLGDGLSPPSIPQQPPSANTLPSPNALLSLCRAKKDSGLLSENHGSHRMPDGHYGRPAAEDSATGSTLEHLGPRHSQTEAMMGSMDYSRRSSHQMPQSRLSSSSPSQPYAAMSPSGALPYMTHQAYGPSYGSASGSGGPMNLSPFPSELAYHQGYGRPDYPPPGFSSGLGGPHMGGHVPFRPGVPPGMYTAPDVRASYSQPGSYPPAGAAGQGMGPASTSTPSPSSATLYGMRQMPPGFASRPSTAATSVASTTDPSLKRNKILERNRQAAVRSRQKKKKELENLVQTLDAMEERYLDLENQLRVARKERDDLRRKLFSHRDCGCDVIGTYEQLQKLQSKNRSYTDSKSGFSSVEDLRGLSAKEPVACSLKGKRSWSSQLKRGSFSSTSSRREGAESNDGDEDLQHIYSDDEDTSSQYDSSDMMETDPSEDHFGDRRGFNTSRTKGQRLE